MTVGDEPAVASDVLLRIADGTTDHDFEAVRELADPRNLANPPATLRARGLVHEPTDGTWEPDPSGPIIDPPVSDLVKDQRR